MKFTVLVKIIIALILLFSLTLPVLEVKPNTSEKLIEGLGDKLSEWTNNLLGDFSETLGVLKEKLLKKEQIEPRTFWENVKTTVFSGYGHGLSPAGSTYLLWDQLRFGQISLLHLLNLLITLCSILQILFLNYFLRKRNGFLGILNILLILSVYGYSVEDEYYNGFFKGITFYLIIQISYVLFNRFYVVNYRKKEPVTDR
ncbi:MAG: hypothetical protein R3277_04330 [Brumimicrobium sp.]|nr:hypothetical protein [Brumimicrobium sp.]